MHSSIVPTIESMELTMSCFVPVVYTSKYYQIRMEVSFMVKNRVAYSADIKNKAVEMKLQGYSTKQVMQELNIKNKTQVETWFRWYKNGETHRFHPTGG